MEILIKKKKYPYLLRKLIRTMNCLSKWISLSTNKDDI